MERRMIFVTDHIDGSKMTIDAYRIESYKRPTEDGDGVDVIMHSGERWILSMDLDQDLYEGEDLVTLLDTLLF